MLGCTGDLCGSFRVQFPRKFYSIPSSANGNRTRVFHSMVAGDESHQLIKVHLRNNYRRGLGRGVKSLRTLLQIGYVPQKKTAIFEATGEMKMKTGRNINEMFRFEVR